MAKNVKTATAEIRSSLESLLRRAAALLAQRAKAAEAGREAFDRACSEQEALAREIEFAEGQLRAAENREKAEKDAQEERERAERDRKAVLACNEFLAECRRADRLMAELGSVFSSLRRATREMDGSYGTMRFAGALPFDRAACHHGLADFFKLASAMRGARSSLEEQVTKPLKEKIRRCTR